MKKRIISALLAVCLLASLGTVGVFADGAQVVEQPENAVGSIVSGEETKYYTTDTEFVEAINKAASGAEVTLLKDITVDVASAADNSGAIVISGTMNINGGGHKITATGGSGDSDSHVLNIVGSSANVTINGLVIDGNSVAHHGIHVYDGAKAALNNVTIGGHCAYGLVVNNGASVEADKLIVNAGAAGAWGSVNVDAKDTKATATLTGGSLASDLVLESTVNTATSSVTLNGVDAAVVKTNDHNNAGINNITINGGNIDTISLNGEGKDTVKIDDANVTTISSAVTNNEKPNITITGNSTIGTVPTDDSVDMIIGNDVTIGGKPAGNAEAEIKGQPYATLAEALAAAEDGDIVELNSNITVDLSTFGDTQAPYRISKDIKLDGNNHTITATGNTESNRVHVILVEGNGTDAEITDLNVNGGKVARYGIQAVGNVELELNDVDVRNCTAYGVFANRGASVVANELSTRDNGWGGVNVDTNGGNSKFVMNSGTLAEEYSVVIENSTGASATTTTTLNNGTFNKIQVKTGSGETNNLTINGGRYTDIVGDTESSDGPVKSQTKVTAGTFDNPVDDVAQTPDYRVDRTNGTHNYYKTIERAMNNANPGDDIEYLGSSRTYEVEFVYSKSYSSTVEVIEDDYIELPGGKYDGKEIIGWTRGSVTYKDGDEVEIDRDMTFYVVLKDGEFDIVIDSKIEHGDISTNVNSADKGDTVYIYVDPDTGYVLDDIDVYYGLNYRYSVKVSYVRNNTYRFEMPNADVYITATFKANGMPFVDVHRTQWFYDSIYYVWSNDMMEGDSATTFNPDGTMTRAMFWAVLGRMDGQTITGTNWVEQARNWAMREGVSDGTNPNDYVTREQMVTMLWRYAGEKNGSANLNRYTDSGSVSGYAVEAMRWAIGNGVIQGVTSTTLAPKANATRAECATIFMRFDKM